MAVPGSSSRYPSRKYYDSDDEDQGYKASNVVRSNRPRHHIYAASDEDAAPAIYSHSARHRRYYDSDEGDAPPAEYAHTARHRRYYDSSDEDAAPAVYRHTARHRRYYDSDEGDATPAEYAHTARHRRYYDSSDEDKAIPSQRYRRRSQDALKGPSDARANFPTLFAGMDRSDALATSSRRTRGRYDDADILIPRGSRSTRGSVPDGDAAIPRSSERRKDRRYNDDDDGGVIVTPRGSKWRYDEGNNDAMIPVQISRAIDDERDDDVIVPVRASRRRDDEDDNDVVIPVRGSRRRHYEHDDDVFIPFRGTRRKDESSDCNGCYLRKGMEVLQLRDLETEKNAERRKVSDTIAESNRRGTQARDLDAGQREKAPYREREATVTVYAYSAKAAGSRRQPIAQQRGREDADAMLETSEGLKIRLKRSVRRKL